MATRKDVMRAIGELARDYFLVGVSTPESEGEKICTAFNAEVFAPHLIKILDGIPDEDSEKFPAFPKDKQDNIIKLVAEWKAGGYQK